MEYTGQGPPMSKEEIASYLTDNYRARICTQNKDGTIHVAPVDYRYVDGQVVIMSFGSSRKTWNVKRNRDVTVLVDSESPFKGVLIYGKADVEYDNIVSMGISILERTGLPREKLERFVKAYHELVDWVVLRITPVDIVSFDYSKDEVYNNLIQSTMLEG